MMRDKYANYVVQKAVEVTKPPLKDALIKKILAIPDSNSYSISCLLCGRRKKNAK